MTKIYAAAADAKLLIQIAAGDQLAFKELISRHHASFTAMAFANSLSPADGEEAVSDAFVKIWHSAGLYQDYGIEPKYWLRTLMRHALLDKLRVVKRFSLEQSASQIADDGDFLDDDYTSGAGDSLNDSATPPDVLDSKQAAACFDACLLALSLTHRDTLQRCLVAGQTEALIACEMGQSIGTVKSRKHYAVKKMQVCVSHCLGGVAVNSSHA